MSALCTTTTHLHLPVPTLLPLPLQSSFTPARLSDMASQAFDVAAINAFALASAASQPPFVEDDNAASLDARGRDGVVQGDSNTPLILPVATADPHDTGAASVAPTEAATRAVGLQGSGGKQHAATPAQAGCLEAGCSRCAVM